MSKNDYKDNKQHDTEKSTRKSQRKFKKKYLETNDNENTNIQNLWDAAKAVMRGEIIAIQVFIKKQEKSQ